MAGTSGGDLSEFACCYASGAHPQAKGHMYGRRNLGNGKKEVEGVVALCHAISDVLGVKVRQAGIEE